MVIPAIYSSIRYSVDPYPEGMLTGQYHPRGNPKNPPKQVRHSLFFLMDEPSIALRFNFSLVVDTDVQAPGALHETTVWVKMSQEVFDRFDKKGEGYH